MVKLHSTFLLFFLICATNSARILGIYPLPGHSHYKLGTTLFKELAVRGHDVTVISPFSEKDFPKNGTYRDITLDSFNIAKGTAVEKGQKWNMFKREGLNPFVGAYVVATMATKFMPQILNHTKIQQLLHSNEKFDVVITDNFLSDCFKAFATHFDAPLIVINPVGPNFWINPFVGNPSPPSYIPDILLNYYHPMTFCERMINTLIYGFNYVLYNLMVYPRHAQFVKEYIPRGGNLYDILYNTSLVLLNSHPTLNQPVPTVPNMIEIGGFHMKPAQKLPNDLQEFLDNAKDGVVYFSMGSNLQSVLWPIEKREVFLKTFAKLKMKVLWKWEDDDLPGKPDNVKIAKWVPQTDVLAHPNLKLFITHGGFVSSVETAYHGKPMLAIPIYGDQRNNANFAYKNGFGRYVTYKELTEEKLLETINEMLSNPKYSENAKMRSKIFHDRQVHPMDTAVYWVEYVIRHKGAPHLRVAGVDLPWYKYLLLDVMAVLAITVGSLIFATCFILKKVCNKFCKKKNPKDAKKEKTN